MARATRDGVRRRNQHSFRMARSALLLTSFIVTLDSMIYRTTKFSLAGRQKAIPPPHHLRPAVVKTNSAHVQREGRASGHSLYAFHAQFSLSRLPPFAAARCLLLAFCIFLNRNNSQQSTVNSQQGGFSLHGRVALFILSLASA